MERWAAPSRGVKGAGSTGEDIWVFKKKEGASAGRGGQACGPGGALDPLPGVLRPSLSSPCRAWPVGLAG